MYRLIASEREVIIISNNVSDKALLYTSSPHYIKKFTKLGYKVISGNAYSKTFETSKSNIILRSETPRKKTTRVLTAEHIEKMQAGRSKNKAS